MASTCRTGSNLRLSTFWVSALINFPNVLTANDNADLAVAA